jgi:hypothetical protein
MTKNYSNFSCTFAGLFDIKMYYPSLTENMYRKIFSILIAAAIATSIHAQTACIDLHCTNGCTRDTHPFEYKQLAVPLTLILAGSLRFVSDNVVSLDRRVRKETQTCVKEPFEIDNYTQYSPMVAVYVMNVCGLKGRHNFRDRTAILATSYLIMGISVNAVKYTAKVERPYGFSYNSFPSGHTATVFMAAEYLRMEYKDVSPLIGVAGYLVAGFTGAMRIYNDAHWLSDVIAGAGFGMLSTQAAYWIYPSLQKALFKNTRLPSDTALVPFYDGRNTGISLVMAF